MIPENSLAPTFLLPDKDGVTHSLSEFSGKWILLYFYPKDDTPGCTTEACAFRDSHADFAELNAVIVGISSDSPESHGSFAGKYGLPFFLLSDTERSVISLYGASEPGKKRISYLIDPKGIIRKAYTTVSPEIHAKEVLRDIQEFLVQ